MNNWWNRFSHSSARIPLKKYGQIDNSSRDFQKWNVQIQLKIEKSGLSQTYFAMQILRSSILCSFNGASKNILTVIYEYMLRIPERESTSAKKKTLRRDRVKENWILPQSFIDANILFDLDRPQHASRPTTSIRNNWPSADPPLAGRHLADNWIPNSSPELSYIFFRDAVEILCALHVPGRYYRNIRKSVRACYVRKSRAKPFVDTCVSPTVSCIGCF